MFNKKKKKTINKKYLSGFKGHLWICQKNAKLFTIFFSLYSWIMHGLPSVNYYCKTTWFPTKNQGKMRPWLLSLPQQTWLCLGVGLGCTLVRPRSEDPGEPGRVLWLRPRSSRVLGGPGREPLLRPWSWQTVLLGPYPKQLVTSVRAQLAPNPTSAPSSGQTPAAKHDCCPLPRELGPHSGKTCLPPLT